ncbi:MAG: porin family protein [Hyphomicrobiaceae bacterium]|nr:porin family protein [Hyphomicrobiaceae bacterium]
MRSVRVALGSVLGATLAVTMVAGSALAADMAGGPIVVEGGRPVHMPSALPTMYFGLKAGANLLSETRFTAGIVGTPATKSAYDTGYNAAMAIGYDLGEAFGMFGARGEIELGMMRNDTKSLTVGATKYSGGASTGKTDSTYGLVNAYVDAHLGAFKPYIGAGIGVGYTRFNNHGFTAGATTVVLDDEAVGFAWQASAGVGVQIEEGVVLDVGYRYLSLPGASVKSGAIGNKIDTTAQQVMMTLRYGF